MPLLDVKEMGLRRMNADAGGIGTSLILLLSFDKDKGLGELADGRQHARKPAWSRIIDTSIEGMTSMCSVMMFSIVA